MKELIDLVMQDPENYLVALAGAVKLHKFERAYQDFSKPRILERIYEKNGFVAGFSVTEKYRNNEMQFKIAVIIRDMEINRGKNTKNVIEWLDNKELYNKLSVMHFTDYFEGTFLNTLRKEYPNFHLTIDNLPPFLIKEYDKKGIPISYEGNKFIFQQFDDETFSIRGLPIKIKIGSEPYDIEILKMEIIK